MNKNKEIKSITLSSIILALMCASAITIPLGELRISLQLIFVFLIALFSYNWVNVSITTVSYLILGLFFPFLAGYSSGISPTFGFVIGFIPGAITMFFFKQLFLKRINGATKKDTMLKITYLILSEIICTLIVYIIGAVFMYFYLDGKYNFVGVLGICVVGYIPFDIIKMIIATSIYLALEKTYNKYIGN